MSTFHKWYRRFTVREGYRLHVWGGGWETHSESACKLIKSLLSLLAQWTWSSSTNCILILYSEDCDKQRLSDHLIFSICTHTHSYRGSNAGAWQRFEGSYWCKCIPCNCTSRRSALSRLDAVMSMTDSICFSSLFFLRDLISIPTQSLEFSHLSFLASPLLFLLHQPISSGPSRSDVNYSKEADVTAKQPSDGGGAPV